MGRTSEATSPARTVTFRPVIAGWPVRRGRARILVHDVHKVFGEAVAVRLAVEDDLEILGATTDVVSAVAVARAAGPDLVLFECAADGQQLTDELAALDHRPHLLCISEADDPAAAVAALRSGARGWVPKSASVEMLLTAIRAILQGETWLPPAMLTEVLGLLLAEPVGTKVEPIDTLTHRELDVLWCMIDGLDQAGIARRLFLSVNTVRTHRRRTLTKLGVHSSLEAVELARRAGLQRGNRA